MEERKIDLNNIKDINSQIVIILPIYFFIKKGLSH